MAALATINWNIAIGVAVIAVTAVLTYWGTAHPPTDRRSKLAFGVCGGVVAILLAVQTFQNERAQDRYEAQLDRILKNTTTPPNVQVNVPPPVVVQTPRREVPKHMSSAFIQPGLEFITKELMADKPIKLNIHWVNKGQEPAYKAHTYAGIRLFARENPNATDINAFNELRRAALDSYEKHKRAGFAGHTIGIGSSKYVTLGMEKVSAEQVESLAKDTARFYVFVSARWEGALEELQECFYLRPNQSDLSNPIWRICNTSTKPVPK